jgi:hypothetical protein
VAALSVNYVISADSMAETSTDSVAESIFPQVPEFECRILWQRRFCPGPRSWVSIMWFGYSADSVAETSIDSVAESGFFPFSQVPKILGADYVI